MLNFSSNPLLSKRYSAINSSKAIVISNNVSLRTAVVFLFSLTVFTYITVMIYYSQIYINDTHTLNNIKNFSLGSGILSFTITFFIYQKPGLAPLLAPLYAIIAGIFISGLSFVAEQKFPGIALLTVEITLLTFGVVYLGYNLDIIKVTSKFKTIVYSMIGVIVSLYLLSFILTLFEIQIPLIHNAGVGGALWACFIMITASLHLAIDIDKVERNHSPYGYINWSLAVGLMVSLIWLYISTLRFLLTVNKLKQQI